MGRLPYQRVRVGEQVDQVVFDRHALLASDLYGQPAHHRIRIEQSIRDDDGFLLGEFTQQTIDHLGMLHLFPGHLFELLLEEGSDRQLLKSPLQVPRLDKSHAQELFL